METDLLLSSVESLRVVERRDDGSGVVEVPVAVPAVLDLSKTKSNSRAMFSLDLDVFNQVVTNFAKRPGPKPVYYDHIPKADRRTTPAAGFIEAAFVENGKLWNRIDLNAQAFDAIVVQRGFRAASVELELDKAAATGVVSGWSQGGLAITNTPATDVEWRVAASAENGESVFLSTGLKEKPMSEVTLSQLQTDNTVLRASVKELEGTNARLTEAARTSTVTLAAVTEERDTARVQAANAKTELSDVKATNALLTSQVATLTVERDSARKKVSALEKEGLSKRVKKTIELAVSEGVDAAFFDGADEDPAAWLAANFASVDSFETFVKAIPRRKGSKKDVVNSREKGTGPGHEDDEDNGVSPTIAAKLAARGLDPRYANIHDASELVALREKE